VDFAGRRLDSPGPEAAGQPAAEEREVLAAVRATLLLPLQAKDRLLGIISLGPRLGEVPFSGEDQRLLVNVAAQTSIALENARLLERMIEEERRRREVEVENERRAKELEEARQLRLSMLPYAVPQLPGLEVAAYMKPATEVGGDYYDFHLSEDGTLTIAVGDATGHGLRAGTMVTATKGLFNAFAHEAEIPYILQQSSLALKRMNLRALYMALVMLKIKGDRLKVSAAGMPPLLIYRAASGAVEEVLIKGMPLGSVASYPYQQRELDLAEGDTVVLMSDGLPERFNERGEIFDYAQARRALEEVAQRSPQEIIDHFVRAGEAWAEGRPLDDDMTFVVLKKRDGDGRDV
jgi:serine phosphatase RsbU (regulator of sigma subunit)